MPFLNKFGGGSSRGFGFSKGRAPIAVQYVVLGGGNASTTGTHGGGGAGSYRSSVVGETTSRGASPEAVIDVPTAQGLVVTVGGGGSSSVFHTITSAAGVTGDFYNGGGAGGAVSGSADLCRIQYDLSQLG